MILASACTISSRYALAGPSMPKLPIALCLTMMVSWSADKSTGTSSWSGPLHAPSAPAAAARTPSQLSLKAPRIVWSAPWTWWSPSAPTTVARMWQSGIVIMLLMIGSTSEHRLTTILAAYSRNRLSRVVSFTMGRTCGRTSGFGFNLLSRIIAPNATTELQSPNAFTSEDIKVVLAGSGIVYCSCISQSSVKVAERTRLSTSHKLAVQTGMARTPNSAPERRKRSPEGRLSQNSSNKARMEGSPSTSNVAQHAFCASSRESLFRTLMRRGTARRDLISAKAIAALRTRDRLPEVSWVIRHHSRSRPDMEYSDARTTRAAKMAAMRTKRLRVLASTGTGSC
jgi:hypothetical protein